MIHECFIVEPLSNPGREVINRNVVVILALEQGFNAFLPVYHGGVDFIPYRESDGSVCKVQLAASLKT